MLSRGCFVFTLDAIVFSTSFFVYQTDTCALMINACSGTLSTLFTMVTQFYPVIQIPRFFLNGVGMEYRRKESNYRACT